MIKVTRFSLIIHQMDKDGNEIDYQKIRDYLWELQKQTRTIKNKAVQICWDFQNKSMAYHDEHGVYLKDKDEYGMSLRGYLYACLKNGVDIYSMNIVATTDKAYKEFDAAKKDILRGDRSILSYKKNQPLELHNESIVLSQDGDKYIAKLKLFNTSFKGKTGYPYTFVDFLINVRDHSQKAILNRCINGTYKITASKLIYNEKKYIWELNLGYNFTPETAEELDPDRILGVDLGVHYPICASVYGELPRLTIPGGEIEEFRQRVEARKRSLQNQGKYCGEGRIGHGRATRCKPVDNIEDKIARFRDTRNHQYSKALIDYAIKCECGTIQMEDLTGVTDGANRFLKNWTYFDLQTKIEYKAEAAGIKVVKIKPQFTSQRCSKCGYIDRENRPTQAEFKCLKCGYEANADYNASQNIAIRGIDKIIEKQLKREP